MKQWILVVLSFSLCNFLSIPSIATSDNASQNRTIPQQGILSGHVVTDTAQPLVNARITIARVGDQKPAATRTTVTDERGSFQFGGLASGNYSLSVRAPGYVRADAIGLKYHRPGDNVTITMLKGSVIAGIVRDVSGEPVVAVAVRAYRLSDPDGRPVTASGTLPSRLTDDRGVYRLYGLAPGYYLVCAGGAARPSAGFNKYQRQAATYYPSSARQTAERILLQPGQEVSNIDIVFRGEDGHVVSGMITGLGASRLSQPVTVALIEKSINETRDISYTAQDGNFVFYGVPEGEYRLIAQYSPLDGKERLVSQPYGIRVTRADVSDVKLALSPLASVNGAVLLKPLSKEQSKSCATRERVSVQEVFLSLHREGSIDEAEKLWDTREADGAPDENGDFSIRGITPGRYMVDVALPSGNWFVKAIEIVKAPKRGPNSQEGQYLVGSVSVQRETPVRLSITLAEGAARLNGHVSLDGARTPPFDLSVHLIPADPNDSENPLRFYQSDVRDDGGFSIKSIAPGRYLLFARLNARGSSPGSSADRSPWSAEGRALLRREAKKSPGTIELVPCQETDRQIVRF